MSAPSYNPDNTDIDRIHSAVKREKEDVAAGQGPAPMWIMFIGMIVAIVAGGQLGPMAGGFSFEASNPFALSKAIDTRPGGGGEGAALDPFQLAMKKGSSAYGVCMGCHQAAGTGVPGTFPPLAGSDWVSGGTERIIRVILHGLTGELKINGSPFSNPAGMPAQGALSNKDIAAVATFIRNSWGNEGTMVTEEMVSAIRKKEAARTTQWTMAELEPFAKENAPGEIPAGPGATAAPAAAEAPAAAK